LTLVVDNYDSFTFNLVQLLGKLGNEVRVFRNDQASVEELKELNPERVVISPGPGRPEDAGVTRDAIREFGRTIPVLGVCLGHQAIGQVFGGQIVHAPELMHGRVSTIEHTGGNLYASVPASFSATRYHSLVISSEGFPEELQVTARTAEGIIMGVRHRWYPIEGVQFHPESILTKHGETMIRNWLEAG
jgi:anthranilate synthase/aminodeoxychorismate synthase-like glutamine amidotransferase